ncbi:MAG: carbon storage regulator [Planctomycetales bacterium]|nr:carbon storage regulator [Planctomycetales bacterium]
MLILTRNSGESFRVRVGVEAPKTVPVHRSEVYDAIQAAKEAKEKRDAE